MRERDLSELKIVLTGGATTFPEPVTFSSKCVLCFNTHRITIECMLNTIVLTVIINFLNFLNSVNRINGNTSSIQIFDTGDRLEPFPVDDDEADLDSSEWPITSRPVISDFGQQPSLHGKSMSFM